MPRYAIFGGVLDSEVPFDGLRECRAQSSTWTFRVDDSGARCRVAMQVGRERVSDALTLTLSRTQCGGVMLAYSAYGLGEFFISSTGREIVWRPGAGARREFLRWVLLGRVMATAMYLGGIVCLHGSAVSIDGDGICFLAPKFHGKSTLAAALVAAGARLVTDDVLPIETGAGVAVRPGVPTLRLRRDSEAAVALHGMEAGRAADDVGKARIDLSSSTTVISGPEPLRAVYVLDPVPEEPAPGTAVTRTRLGGVSALQTLVRHGSIAPLLSAGEARLLVEFAAATIRAVPVYSLRTVRDLRRLPEVVDQLLAWHGARVAGARGEPLASVVA
jgi:hypothetical protein